jgi:YTH domain-containing family protein
MYHSGYGYASYAPYTSPGSPVPSVGHDGSYYGTQQYQFPGSFYQQIPKKTTYTKKNNTSTQGVVSATQVSDNPPLSADAANLGSNSVNGNKNMTKGSYTKVPSGNGVASSSYQNQTRAGKKSPWSEGNMFSDKQDVPVTTGLSGNSKLQGKNQNHHPIPYYMVSLYISLL